MDWLIHLHMWHALGKGLLMGINKGCETPNPTKATGMYPEMVTI